MEQMALPAARKGHKMEPATMQIRAPEAPCEAKRGAPGTRLCKAGLDFLQIPSLPLNPLGELGDLPRRALGK
eukprot:15485272-Alexandrium_andersonii.AAC.1